MRWDNEYRQMVDCTFSFTTVMLILRFANANFIWSQRINGSQGILYNFSIYIYLK